MNQRWLTIRPGDRVRHRQRGEGLVLGMSPGGKAKVRLDGDPGLPWTLPLAELQPIEPPPPEPSPEPAMPVRRPSGPSIEGLAVPDLPNVPPVENSLVRAELRQTIEAMRLGVVPAEYVRDYTVGRDGTLEAVEDILEMQGGMRVLWGDYGSGKTHMLDITERIALERGYLTSRVVLDPHEVPPSHPRRLYSAIVDHLRYPDDQGHGLEPLFQKLAGSGEHARPDGHFASRFFSPYLFASEQGDPEFLDWMRDYVDGCNMDVADGNRQLAKLGWTGKRLLTLSDYRTYGRMYMHLLGNVAAWAQDAGYQGLFLLFDEVEFVDSLSPQELGYAMEVLKHYAAVTVPKGDLGYDPDALYRGGHRVHRELRLFFRSSQPLTVMFALTPLPDIEEAFQGILSSELYNIALEPLQSAHMGQLMERVLRLYLQAYPDAGIRQEDLPGVLQGVQDAAADRGSSPRVLVRALASQLDACRWKAKRDARRAQA